MSSTNDAVVAKARVLLVDDDLSLLALLRVGLAHRGYQVFTGSSVGDAITLLRETEVDVVITDLAMPDASGIELCEHIAVHHPATSMILITGFGTFDAAVSAVRAGVRELIRKPVDLDDLARAIERRVPARARPNGGDAATNGHSDASTFGESFVAVSDEMRALCELVERVAPSDVTVLVTGESGTGKEEIARAIHRRSRRRGGPFVAINCAAVAESLLESELFGHVRGAFTDARTTEPGLFVSADGGTLFLDELGDMPLSIQPKLLRVLQERTVRPVGSNRERRTDTRVVGATNHDIEALVAGGRFREDLYYRVNVVHVRVPALRERRDDILPLARHFIRQAAANADKEVVGLSPAAADRLLAYRWPGNVRELQNCIERGVALTSSTELSLDDLPLAVRAGRAEDEACTDRSSAFVRLDELDRQHIGQVLDAVGRNKSAAARVLGINRKRLYRMLTRLGLERVKA